MERNRKEPWFPFGPGRSVNLLTDSLPAFVQRDDDMFVLSILTLLLAMPGAPSARCLGQVASSMVSNRGETDVNLIISGENAGASRRRRYKRVRRQWLKKEKEQNGRVHNHKCRANSTSRCSASNSFRPTKALNDCASE